MNRDSLHTRVIVFLIQVIIHVGMIVLFGWFAYKAGTALNLFQPDSWFAYGASTFSGLVVTDVIGFFVAESKLPH